MGKGTTLAQPGDVNADLIEGKPTPCNGATKNSSPLVMKPSAMMCSQSFSQTADSGSPFRELCLTKLNNVGCKAIGEVDDKSASVATSHKACVQWYAISSAGGNCRSNASWKAQRDSSVLHRCCKNCRGPPYSLVRVLNASIIRSSMPSSPERCGQRLLHFVTDPVVGEHCMMSCAKPPIGSSAGMLGAKYSGITHDNEILGAYNNTYASK